MRKSDQKHNIPILDQFPNLIHLPATNNNCAGTVQSTDHGWEQTVRKRGCSDSSATGIFKLHPEKLWIHSPPPTPSITQSSCSNTFQSFVLKANKGEDSKEEKDIYEADAQVKELWLDPFWLSQNVPGAAGRAAGGGWRDPSIHPSRNTQHSSSTFYRRQKEDKNCYKKKPSLISVPKTR